MAESRVEMAVHKTEALLVTKRKKTRILKIVTDRATIGWKKQITGSLGVKIDRNLSFGPHIIKIALKAFRTVGNCSRLMTNLGGEQQKKQKLIASVTTSQMLYGAPA